MLDVTGPLSLSLWYGPGRLKRYFSRGHRMSKDHVLLNDTSHVDTSYQEWWLEWKPRLLLLQSR
ncbi:hypothetical protein RB213_000663 [Colletotrichum asianum]